MTNELKVLENNVKFYPLTVENDFKIAQDFLNIADATEDFDAKEVYSDRVNTVDHLLGTYIIKVERTPDYERFISKFRKEKNHRYEERNEKKTEVRNRFYSEEISREDAVRLLDSLDREYDIECGCKVCKFPNISFENWKDGKLDNGRKLGKEMRKAGFSQELLDFYSAQVKTEKDVCLTISDKVHHITGMSAYAKLKSWNQWNGTSCQDVRHNSDLCEHLIGSLHDDKLFIGMLHDSLEDLEDMTDKLKARTMLRLFMVEGKPCLLSGNYYGNNETQSNLDKALKSIEHLGIFSNDVYNGWDKVELKTTYKRFEEYTSFDVHIYLDDEYEIRADCPVCNYDQEIIIEDEIGNEHRVTCPVCGGDGRIEIPYTVEVDEWETIEDYKQITPYPERFEYYSEKVSVYVNSKYIEEKFIG